MYVKGMKVIISEQGHDKWGFDKNNPPRVVGVCSGRDGDLDDEWFSVDWPDGGYNNYEEGDLIVVEDAPRFYGKSE